MKHRKNTSVKAKRKRIHSDKLVKTSIIKSNSYISKHLPETSYLTEASLFRMINRYSMVYIKPKNGSYGRGVMKITKNGTRYSCHNGRVITIHSSYSSLYRSLKSITKGEAYIVQRGIQSIRYNGRVVDFRVVVQKSPYGGFEVTGMAGRISQAGRVVSNGGGGAVGSLDSLLSYHQRTVAIPRMKQLCIAILMQARKHWSYLNEIGVDIALDYHLKPWIIEYNTRPDHRMFVMLGDRRTVAKIVHYGARYGRKYKLYR